MLQGPKKKKEILRKNLIFQKEVTLRLLPLSQGILKGMCQELCVHTTHKQTVKEDLNRSPDVGFEAGYSLTAMGAVHRVKAQLRGPSSAQSRPK